MADMLMCSPRMRTMDKHLPQHISALHRRGQRLASYLLKGPQSHRARPPPSTWTKAE